MRSLHTFVCLSLLISVARPAAAARAQPGDTEIFLINYQAQAKDAAAATAMSIFPGFGVGHFYAESPLSGIVVGGGELLGVGLFSLSFAANAESGSRDVLQILGALLYAAFKIADVTYAPFAVADYNRDLAMRLRIPIIGGARRSELEELPAQGQPAKKAEPRPPEVPEGFQY
jgi:hypothetical protein